LTRVITQGESLSGAIPAECGKLEPQGRALAQELSYGTLRWYPRLKFFLDRMLEKPLKRKEQPIESLLLLGLYQLDQLEIPPHAAVSETVAVTALLSKKWARGLVNALLRRFQRERDQLRTALEGDEAARYAHPQWLLQRLQQAWPERWQAIAAANNARPPMTLRNNARHQSREAYLQRLAEAGIAACAAPEAKQAITLKRPVSVDSLPGFFAGDVSVQDGAAQLAAQLLDPQPGERILDACAAPGGKSVHLLEHGGETVQLDALDIDSQRLARVAENLERAGVSARLVEGDAAAPDTWWDGQPYDRILLDAPCSASGVIRRHPDIKLLRRQSDIENLVALQGTILRALWPLLRRGGILLYATCSVLPQENSEQVSRFLREQEDAQEIPIAAQWGIEVAAGRQIVPQQDGMDGFYYARIKKLP
jgi:16S rRNA (cytosine967-C5)-methyltransferase